MVNAFRLYILLIGLMLHALNSTCAQEIDTVVVDTGVVASKLNYFNAVSEETSTPVVTRTVPPAVIDSLRREEEFWYSDYEPKRKKSVAKKPSAFLELLSSVWFRILLWTIIISGFIAILIWFLKTLDIRLYRKKEAATPIHQDGIQEDIFAINYDAEISAAISSGNYRQAVRLLYLHTLRQLSQTGKIDYSQERTNSMYRQQLAGTPLHQPFTRLTRHFEFVWYGQFPLSMQAFERIHQDYLGFRKEVTA